MRGEHPRETGAASRGNALRRAPDQLKKNRLLGDRGRDRAEMGVLHHPVSLNQRIHHITAAEAAVPAQPHGVITFLEIDQIVHHH